MGFHVSNEPNRIARLELLAVHPRFRGGAWRTRRHGCSAPSLLDLDFHRLEMEIYGFNERAQAHAGARRVDTEGVKRRAYLRDGRWEDGVIYALAARDLGSSARRDSCTPCTGSRPEKSRAFYEALGWSSAATWTSPQRRAGRRRTTSSASPARKRARAHVQPRRPHVRPRYGLRPHRAGGR